MKLVEKLDYQFNFVKLKNECPDITGDSLGLKMKGLSVQHRKNVLAPWNTIDGLESKKLYRTKYCNKNCTEEDFNTIHENFVNTEYERIITDFKLVRSRLMLIESLKCYSIHQDRSWRLHIPIETNTECLFYFPDHKEHFHLEEGKIYKVNTIEKHTFINAGLNNRIHFVGCLYDS